MTEQSFKAGWVAIDQTSDPAYYVRFMDNIRRGKSDSDPKLYHHLFDALAAQPGETILDVGCGAGGAVRALAPQVGATGRVVGIDSSATMIAEAQKRATGVELPIEFRLADAQALPFDDNTFDGCYSTLVFEILPDPHQALAEMVRVLRPGGRLVVGAPDADSEMIDSSNRDVTRRFLHFVCDHECNGWIGRQLSGYAHELGLIDSKVALLGDSTTDFAFIYEFWYRQYLERAQAAGVLSALEVAEWVADQEARQRTGRCFIAGLWFLLSARKPAASATEQSVPATRGQLGDI